MEYTEQDIALVFKALADENRVHILKSLRNGEKCACELLEELNIHQSTLSHHMKILCDAGIVTGRKDGKWMHYCICCDGVCNLRKMLKGLLFTGILPPDCICKED